MTRKFAEILVIIFIFTIPCENIFTLGSLGSISRLIGLITAAVWGISILVQKKVRVFSTFHFLAFSFFLFSVASIFWTVDHELTFARAITFIQMAIQIWMLWDLLTTERLYRFALLAFILGTYVIIIDTIGNFFSGQIISEWDYGRYSGGGQNAVELALILSLCFPIAWYLAITEKSDRIGKIIKIICYSFIPSAFFAIILTASRTAILTVLPGIFFILGSLNRMKRFHRSMIFIFAIILLFVGQSIIPQETLERLSTFGTSISSGDLGGRTDLWRGSIQIFIDHPLLGIGSGSTASSLQLGAVAHNTFLSILSELGLFGFIIFICMIISLVFLAIKQPLLSSSLWLK